MATPRKVTLRKLTPEHWIGAVVVVAALLRLWNLSGLPPGLTPAEANTGLASLALLHHHQLWSHGTNPASLAYSWLASIFIALFGPTALAARLLAALAGIAAVIGTYLWLRARSGLRDGLIGAVIVGGLAWQIGLSREAGPAALVPAAVAWWLWFQERAEATDRPLWRWWSAGLLAAMLYISPTLWWLDGAVILLWLYKRFRTSGRRTVQPLVAALWIIIAWPAAAWAIRSGHYLLHISAFKGFFGNLVRTLSLFVVAGGGWQATFGGQALLNAFYLIMAVLGILVAVVRWRREGRLLALWLLSLVAGAVAWPNVNAALALGAIPLVGLIVLGIRVMLERWYSTFPINSAARTVGRGIVGFLIVLAAYQGYVQYFVAFADSSETHDLYHEDYQALALQARHLTKPVIVTDTGALSVLTYLDYPAVPLFTTPAAVQAKQVTGQWYLIGFNQKAQMVPILQQIAPGGALLPHYSSFDGRELYFTYRTK